MRHRLILLFMALSAAGAMQAYNDTIIRHYTDTVTTITMVPDSTLKQREVIIPADSLDRRGHYVEAYLGMGYGSLGYRLNNPNSRTNGSFSALLQAQYAYFFTSNWGIGAGLWFTNYTDFARWGGDFVWTADQSGNPLYDSDYEQNYQHTAHIVRWRERQTIHNIGIPISVQFQYQKEDWKARIFASVGIAPAFSVSKKYRILQGEIDHSGYYPAWDLNLDNMHEFGRKDYRNVPEAKGPLSVRTQADIFADFGALLPVNKQIDMFVGGYFNVSLNDANSSNKQALGWKDAAFTFMNDYRGAYATDLASASHPWQVGVKVGIHWHYIAPDKHEMEDYFEYFEREERETQYIARADTSIIEHPDPIIEVAQEVEKFNKIYFAFDSYRLTLKSKNYLQSIVETLNKTPNAKIAIDGHASSEGQTEYNNNLSLKRARAVANYLVELGIDRNRIVTDGHGSRLPNEDTEYEERSRDRRVEVKVILDENAQ